MIKKLREATQLYSGAADYQPATFSPKKYCSHTPRSETALPLIFLLF